jgi:hypothetical protein
MAMKTIHSKYHYSELEEHHTSSDEPPVIEDPQRRLQLQALDNEIEYNEALITEREGEIQEIEHGITELNEIFRDLGTLVNEQESGIRTYNMSDEMKACPQFSNHFFQREHIRKRSQHCTEYARRSKRIGHCQSTSEKCSQEHVLSSIDHRSCGMCIDFDSGCCKIISYSQFFYPFFILKICFRSPHVPTNEIYIKSRHIIHYCQYLLISASFIGCLVQIL